jgi:N-acetyl-anhydromuramyl-L-alanine amidase AmpD
MTPELQAKIKSYPLAADQYYTDLHPKKTIVLHHTAGGSAQSSIDGWGRDAVRVATCVVIERDGTIWQCFGTEYWAFSLGLTTANYREVEQQTVAIELANYGYLIKKADGFYNAYGMKMHDDLVYDCKTNFRGQQYYETYTAEQIESLRLLLEHLHEKFGIDLTYHSEMFDLNQSAIHGASGIWSHTSYRSDKSDISPQIPMIQMLQNLQNSPHI